MHREPGLFSNRYLNRRGKENHNHTNAANLTHNRNEEVDFPLALTSTKVMSKERNSISVRKKKDQRRIQTKPNEEEPKSQDVARLQKDVKQAKQQIKRLNRQLSSKTLQYENYIKELTQQIKQKEQIINKITYSFNEEVKKCKEQTNKANRFSEVLRQQIYWVLKLFLNVQKDNFSVEECKKQIGNNFISFKEFIQQFKIQKQLQSLASISNISHNQPSSVTHVSSIFRSQQDQTDKKNMNSMFTEDLQEHNMVRLMELHPLIETFNNQQQLNQNGQVIIKENSNQKMERITKKLFDDSPLFKEEVSSGNLFAGIGDHSENQQISVRPEYNIEIKNEQICIQLPCEVTIIEDFAPSSEQQNYIVLKKGEQLKLLRRIRKNLWIGQFGQKIGLVLQQNFKLHQTQ